MGVRVCTNCGQPLSGLERAFVHNNRMVCGLCRDLLSDPRIKLPSGIHVRPAVSVPKTKWRAISTRR